MDATTFLLTGDAHVEEARRAALGPGRVPEKAGRARNVLRSATATLLRSAARRVCDEGKSVSQPAFEGDPTRAHGGRRAAPGFA